MPFTDLPDFARILVIEWDLRTVVAKHTNEFLGQRIKYLRLYKAIVRRKFPLRWQRKFNEQELDNRLSLLEKIVSDRGRWIKG